MIGGEAFDKQKRRRRRVLPFLTRRTDFVRAIRLLSTRSRSLKSGKFGRSAPGRGKSDARITRHTASLPSPTRASTSDRSNLLPVCPPFSGRPWGFLTDSDDFYELLDSDTFIASALWRGEVLKFAQGHSPMR